MNKERAIEVLKNTRATILEGWCKGVSARDKQGNEVSSHSAGACQWCLSGALSKSVASDDEFTRVRSTIYTIIGDHGLASFNDSPRTTREMVIEAIDKTIQLVEGRGIE